LAAFFLFNAQRRQIWMSVFNNCDFGCGAGDAIFPAIAMTQHYAQLITTFPLFNGFTVHGAEFILERGRIKEHAAGEVITREGDRADFVLLVLTGKAQVFVERQGRELVLTEAGPGAILGELAVLCGIPRAASLRASEQLAALHWEKDSFRRMLLGHVSLSERVFSQSLRTLIEKEKSLIQSLYQQPAAS
jgi:CRP/FNR family transcriptional regulator, cyclic AMP receptor protein